MFSGNARFIGPTVAGAVYGCFISFMVDSALFEISVAGSKQRNYMYVE